MRQKMLFALLCLLLLLGLGQEALAQDKVSQILKDIAKDVVLDPTTYVPGTMYFISTKLDWDTSQVFFKNGFLEKNPDFTISGKGNDLPLSHSAGNKRIIAKTLPVLGWSLLNNAGAEVSERVLTRFYPKHKKLIKWICRIEKIAGASYFGYYYSVRHFSQWQTNKNMARELGLN